MFLSIKSASCMRIHVNLTASYGEVLVTLRHVLCLDPENQGNRENCPALRNYVRRAYIILIQTNQQ